MAGQCPIAQSQPRSFKIYLLDLFAVDVIGFVCELSVDDDSRKHKVSAVGNFAHDRGPGGE